LEWCETLPKAFTVKSIHIQSLDLFGRPPRQRVGFVKFVAELSAAGKEVPGIVFARGGAIAVLVLLQCKGKDYALMTRQARVPIGSSGFDEVPAGMLDGRGEFAGVAAKELKEETGLEIRDRDLIDMTHMAYSALPLSRPLSVLRDGTDEAGTGTVMGIYPSPGACDEYLRVFLFRKQVTSEELAEMQAHIRGEEHENERIAVRVVPLEDVWKWTPDSKSHSAVLLYEQLLRSGELTRA
jgi:ADP-sugar diphosphatase